MVEDKAEELPSESNMFVGGSSATMKYVSFRNLILDRISIIACDISVTEWVVIVNQILQPEESEWDEFGNDLYAIPEMVPTQPSNPVVEVSPASKIDEENKIKALIETPALDWSR